MRKNLWKTWLRSVVGRRLVRMTRNRFDGIVLQCEELESRLTPAAPSVLSMSRLTPLDAVTNAHTIHYEVIFNEPVTGVDATDFRVVLNGSLAASTPQVAGGGAVYSVTVNNILGNGTIGLNFVDDGSVRDLDGHTIPSSASFFAPQQTYSLGTGSDALCIVAADFNNDQKLDILTGNYSNMSMSVLLGNGNGTFRPALKFAAPDRVESVAVADFNRDGNVDVVSVHQSGAYRVFLGNGNGTFRAPTTLSFGTPGPTVLASDVNLDGNPDIVGFNFATDGVAIVFLGNGDGTFQTVKTFAAGAKSFAGTVADLNLDGIPDIVVGNHGPASNLGILIGNGDGTFKPVANVPIAAGLTEFLDVGDIDLDGLPDVVIHQFLSNIGIFRGNGDGTLNSPINLPMSRGPVAIADLDRDLLPDLAFIDGAAGNNRFSIIRGNGNGTFAPPSNFDTGNMPQSFVIDDFNGDGRLDVVVANRFSASISALLAVGTDFTGPVVAVDQAAPTTAITSTPQPLEVSRSATFSFAATDPTVDGITSGVAKLEYRLDGAAFTSGSSPVQLTNLPVGPHKFEVRAVDGAGNVGPTASYDWIVDDNPVLLSILPTASTPTLATVVTYDLHFNGAVSGIDPSDFAAIVTGTLSTGPILVSGGGDRYSVSVTGISGDGTLLLRLLDDDSIVADITGSPLAGPGNNGGGDGSVYRIDHTAPSVTITGKPPAETPNRAATFSFTGNDPTVGGVSTGVARFETSLDGAPFTTATSPITLTSLAVGDRVFRVRAIDTVGNVGETSYSWHISQAPAVQSVVRAMSNSPVTTSKSSTYTVNFNMPVTGVDPSDFRIITSGAVSTNPAILVNGAGNSYTVTVSGIHGVGTIRLALVDDDSIIGGPFSYPLGAPGVRNGSFEGPTSFVQGDIAPSVVGISRHSPLDQYANDAVLGFNVVFSEPVVGVDLSDFQLSLSGSASATLSEISQINPTLYRITVIGAAGFGRIGIDLVDNGTIRDADGNLLVNRTTFFGAPTTVGVHSGINSIVAQDLNGDGKVDLAATSQLSNFFNVRIGAGNGTFPTHFNYPVSQIPRSLVSADINGDGYLDLLSLLEGGTPIGVIRPFLGSATGAFASAGSIPAPLRASMATGDLNCDGKADLVTTDFAKPSVARVRLGNGDGTFSAESSFAVPDFNGLMIGDTNNDSIPDLIVGGTGVYVLLGNGDGTFKAQLTTPTNTPGNSAQLAMGDINNDGILDLAMVSGGVSEGMNHPHKFVILLGNGNGTFRSSVLAQSTGAASSLSFGDIDGDGNLDLLHMTGGSNLINLYLGNGNGTFRVPVVIASSNGVAAGAIADFNGDGRPDFVAAPDLTSSLSLRLALDGSTKGQTYVRSPTDVTLPSVRSIINDPPYLPGLMESSVSGSFDTSNPGTPTGMTTGVRMAQTTSDWTTNRTFIYSGQIFDGDGIIAFGENFDDSIAIKIDGTTVLSNTSRTAPSTTGWMNIGMGPGNDGWHDIEIRLGNTSLPAGPVVASGWTATKGFGVNFSPSISFNSTNGADYVVPVDPGDQSVFRSRVTNAQSTSYTVAFTEDVTGVDPSDFQLEPTGTLTAGTVSVNAINARTYTVAAPVSGSGTLALKLTDDGSIRDLSGKPLVASPPNFAPQSLFLAADTVVAAVTADLDGDGKLDLVSANVISLSVLLGNGDGTFKPRTNINVGKQIHDVKIVDINGDGKQDIVFSAKGDGSIDVLLGNGDGTFKPTITTASSSPVTFALADLNNDGKLDVISAIGAASGGAGILLGNGDGRFAARPALSIGSIASGVVVGDFNGDGRPDVLVSSTTAAMISFFAGNGDGTFRPRTTFTSTANENRMAAADLDGDGKLDFVVTNSGGFAEVFLGNGNGTFKPMVTYTAGATGTTGIRIVDISGDGRLDLVIPTADSSGISILQGNGDGTFLAPIIVRTFGAPQGEVPVGDFNGDQRPDFATATNTGLSSSISVRLATDGSATSLVTSFDQAAPTVTISAGPPAFSNSSSPSFAFTAIDPLVGGVTTGVGRFEAQIDGSAFAPTANPHSLSGLSEGPHTYSVRAVDQAGNIGTVSTYSWVTVYTPPQVTGISPASGLPSGGNTITISGNNFIGVTAVKFGVASATSFVVVSATQISAVVPAGTGTVDVSVTNVAGSSSLVASDRYSYVRATPVITWSNPADIVYGEPLGASQLNATANVPGVFTYSPASGVVLHAGQARPLTVTFTPSNLEDYTTAQMTVFINVKRARLTIRANNITVTGSYTYSPLPSATFIGLVKGDTPATIGKVGFVIQTIPSFVHGSGHRIPPKTPAKFGPGTYTIIAVGGLSSDYDITYIAGTLVVLPSTVLS